MKFKIFIAVCFVKEIANIGNPELEAFFTSTKTELNSKKLN